MQERVSVILLHMQPSVYRVTDEHFSWGVTFDLQCEARSLHDTYITTARGSAKASTYRRWRLAQCIIRYRSNWKPCARRRVHGSQFTRDANQQPATCIKLELHLSLLRG